MPRFIKDWLLPLLVISSSGFLGWLINQLPSKQDLHIPDPVIFWLTGGCISAQFIFGFISNQSQPNAAPSIQNSIVGFLPLLGGAALYGLSNYVPAAFSPAVFYASLAMFVLGTLVPPVVFVPLRMSSKSLVQISTRIIQNQASAENLTIWDFLTNIRDQSIYRRIVVIGPPGSGKSTLLEHLTLTYAQNSQRRKHRQAPKLIPVLLRLRQICDQITSVQPPSWTQLITEQDQRQKSSWKLDPPPQWFEERLKHGKCLVMLDGLDEVADKDMRKQVSQWVDQQMQTYPETTFILTSRPPGYSKTQLENSRITLEVQLFNLKEMELFLGSWYLQNIVLRQVRKEDLGVQKEAERKANDLIKRIKDNPPIAAMALNPLLLTMIATVHDNRGALPGSRVELYAEICDVLLVRRQEAKDLSDPLQLKAAQKQTVLQVLALELMQRNTRVFTPDDVKQLIQDQLTAVSGSGSNLEIFLQHIEQDCGLLMQSKPDDYEFAHLSFQEYLAAVQVKETNQEQLLITNISNSWWHETIRLYAARNDTSNLIRAALANQTVESLSLAHDCLEEGNRVDPAVRQQLEKILEEGLESTNPEIAKLAAQVKLTRRLKYATQN